MTSAFIQAPSAAALTVQSDTALSARLPNSGRPVRASASTSSSVSTSVGTIRARRSSQNDAGRMASSPPQRSSALRVMRNPEMTKKIVTA